MQGAADPVGVAASVSGPAPGLLWAYAASEGGAPARLAIEEIPAALQRSDWVWINVDLIDQRVHRWVGEICGVDPADALLADRDAGLAVEHRDGEVHGIFADFTMDFLRVSDSIGRFGFSVSERLLVTGWRHPLASLDAVREAMRTGQRHESAFVVLAAIVSAFARIAAARLRTADDGLDSVEDRLLAATASDERTAIKEVRRLALALHRPVATMVLLMSEAVSDEEAPMPPGAADAAERMAGQLAVLDQSVLQVSDRAKLLQEEMAAELADESNRSLRALTVMTALLLPGSLIAGIFGMNTGGMPFEHSLWGSVGAIVVGACATFVFYRILVRAGASLRF